MGTNEWVENDEQARLPGTGVPSPYLERLAAAGVLDEIDRLYDTVERGEFEPTAPMSARNLVDRARRPDGAAG